MQAPRRCGERCQHIGWLDLLPLGAWLLASGRCRHCGAKLPTGIPVLESFMLLLVALSAVRAPTAPEAVAACVLGGTLIPLVVADSRHQVLPDALTLTLLASGLLAASVLPSATLPAALLGAALGSGSFLAVRWLYLRWRGFEALGLGDVKLMAGLGAWFGPMWLPVLVLVAAGGGLLSTVVLFRMANRAISATTRVPFGVYLGLSALLVWAAKDHLPAGPAW